MPRWTQAWKRVAFQQEIFYLTVYNQKPKGSKELNEHETMEKQFKNFPIELGWSEQLPAAKLAFAKPFFKSFVEASLPHAFRVHYPLAGARWCPIPFANKACLWAFDFASRDGKEFATALVWEVYDRTILVDFCDTTFFDVMRLIRPEEDKLQSCSSAYLALYFETGRARRHGQSFVLRVGDVQCPADIDSDTWASSLAKASNKDAHAIVDRQSGTLDEVTLGKGYFPLPEYKHLVGGYKFPDELPETLVGLQESWYGATLPNLEVWLRGRRANRIRESTAALRRYNSWKPPGIDADAGEVTQEARAMYESRRQEYSWIEVYPPKDDPAREEISELFDQINERCLDYHIPLQSPIAHDNQGESALGIRILRKTLAFYPEHRHYEIIDRRGGYPRRAEILFAPCGTNVPEGVDRLVPLNGRAETIHWLNRAYQVNLSGAAAAEYLDFFCDAVHGRQGRFHIIESIEDTKWRGPALDQQTLLSEALKPIRLWPGREPKRDWLIADALVIYSTELFHAYFHIDPQGQVDMPDDYPIFEHLDVASELFSTKTHFLLLPPIGFKISN